MIYSLARFWLLLKESDATVRYDPIGRSLRPVRLDARRPRTIRSMRKHRRSCRPPGLLRPSGSGRWRHNPSTALRRACGPARASSGSWWLHPSIALHRPAWRAVLLHSQRQQAVSAKVNGHTCHILRGTDGFILPVADQPWYDGWRTPKECLAAWETADREDWKQFERRLQADRARQAAADVRFEKSVKNAVWIISSIVVTVLLFAWAESRSH
jgi:hypothetical protein